MTKLFLFISILFYVNGVAQDYIPPVAKKIPSQLIIHGDTVIDNYFWLRDKYSPEVINHLYAENAYADNMMKQSNFLQKVLYEEYKSRKRENFTSLPVKRKGYLYYSTYEKGKDYPISYRKKDTLNSKIVTVLDPNKLAEGQPNLAVTAMDISPNQQWLYYGVDTKGNRVNTFYLKYIDTDSLYKTESIESVLSIIWAQDNKTIYYSKPEDKTLRSYRIYRHIIGRPMMEDELIIEELDKTFQLDIRLSSSKKYFIISSSKTKSTEEYYLPADGSGLKPTMFLKREPGVVSNIDHLNEDEFVITTNLNAINRRVAKTKINQPATSNWKDIIPHNPNILIESVDFTKDYMIVSEKENAQKRIRIVNLKTNESEILNPGIENYDISTSFEDYDYNTSTVLKYNYSNLINPSKTVLYDLVTKEQKVIQVDTILGDFKSSNYETIRIYAPARDGAKVPITLVYKKGLVLNGKNPFLLYSYGSYGAPNTTGFSASTISYLDRGFVFAIAHIRGSNDLGNQWYENGKLFNKKNWRRARR